MWWATSGVGRFASSRASRPLAKPADYGDSRGPAIELCTLGDGDRPGAVTVRSFKGRRFGASSFWARRRGSRRAAGAASWRREGRGARRVHRLRRRCALRRFLIVVVCGAAAAQNLWRFGGGFGLIQD